jgi:hypothetical protein
MNSLESQRVSAKLVAVKSLQLFYSLDRIKPYQNADTKSDISGYRVITNVPGKTFPVNRKVVRLHL